MRKLLLFVRVATVLTALLGAKAALAVCNGTPPGYPFNCTSAANGPGQNDLVGGGITSGPQNGQSVRWTWGQIFTGTQLISPTIINGTIDSLNAPLAGLYGGTGVANNDTITLGGNVVTAGAFTISGAHSLTLTITGDTNITLPTSGTFLGNTLTNTHILVGNVSNAATDVALSGDATLANTGAVTVGKIGGTSISLGGATALGAASSTVGAGTYFAGHGLIGVQTFCASGCTHTSGTYTPDTGTNQVKFRVQAAGGSSGGCASTAGSANCLSAPGNGGAYTEILFTTGFSGVTITPGAPGAVGSAGNNAASAGTAATVGAIISCSPGEPGVGGAAFPAATFVVIGITAAANTCTHTGGTLLFTNVSVSGTPGIAIGSAANFFGGAGGNSFLGKGGSSPVSGNGSSVGGSYGGGASAVGAFNTSAMAGALGGPALVIVEEYN